VMRPTSHSNTNSGSQLSNNAATVATGASKTGGVQKTTKSNTLQLNRGQQSNDGDGGGILSSEEKTSSKIILVRLPHQAKRAALFALQCAVQHSPVQHRTSRHSPAKHSTSRQSTVQHSTT
jgi:hypothetical protein